MLAVLPAAPVAGRGSPAPTVRPFGHLSDGRLVHRYDLANRAGMRVTLIDYGAAIAGIGIPDRSGQVDDVVLAPGTLDGFVESSRRYGAIVGRYAGRLRGAVTIGGHRYPLATNAKGITLHGGDPGLDHALWSGRLFRGNAGNGVEFTYVSADGEQGFPGRLTISARYLLSASSNRLTLQIRATSNRATVVNLTNHSYFDLTAGRAPMCQRLTANAPRYVETDDRAMPTGRLLPVDGTSLDFRSGRTLADALSAGGPLVARADGLNDMVALKPASMIVLEDGVSGRRLALRTDQPGVQIYTANALDGRDRRADGRPIERRAGVALEAQHFPDSPSIPTFPSTSVTPASPYRERISWSFDTMAPRSGKPCVQ